MSTLTPTELNQMTNELPQKWFLYELPKIRSFEKYAQSTPDNKEIHQFLTRYYHLSGDAEKCAFYAIHGKLNITDQILLQSVESACLDYIIFKQGGFVYGSACVQQPEENEYNQTKSRSKTVIMEQRKPFELMQTLPDSEIQNVVNSVVGRSSREAQVSWKVHSKSLKSEELDQMNVEQLQLVMNDLSRHSDIDYRNEMLNKLLKLYSVQNLYNQAVQCLILLRNPDQIVDYIIMLIQQGKTEEALQSAFSLFENAPNQIIKPTVFLLKTKSSEIFKEDADKQKIANLIADKALTGQISAVLYSDFVSKNYCLDKVALRKMLQANQQTAEQLSAYSLMLSMMSLSTQYYEHRGSVVDKLKFYPRFAHFAQIGLAYRGCAKTPQIYDQLFENFASANPYELGGAVLGLAFQYAGLNTSDSAAMALIVDINDNLLSTRNEDDRGPIISGMALALGLICLGNHEDETCQQLADQMETIDIDAQFSIILGIGLIQLGNSTIFESDLIEATVKPYLACEHEKLRRAACICLSLMCYRQQGKAEQIIKYLQNYATTSQSQFSDTCAQYAPVALGLAYCSTGNIEIAQQLLLSANTLSGTFGAQFAIQQIGFVFAGQQLNDSKQNSIFQLVKMCAKSFDPMVRAGACSVLGQLFAASGNQQCIELLCKMMSDQEENVRCAAVIGQAMVLQNIQGVDLPEAKNSEVQDPVGDRQKNTFYRCDFKTDEEFELEKAQQKLNDCPGTLSERYKEIYVTKHSRPFTASEYASQFRKDLAATQIDAHDNGKETLITVRAQMLALGILNCGGLNMSFKQKTDLQIISFQIYLQSWLWYPIMGTFGLSMECDYLTTVQLQNDEIQEIQLILTIPTKYYEQYGYSCLSKETKHQDIEKYVKKARLSQNEMNQMNDTEIESNVIGGFNYVNDMKDIALQEFAQQANNVKYADAIKDDKAESTEKDECKILETPTRIVDQQVQYSSFIEGSDYVGVFPGIKRGIIVVREAPENE